MAKPIDPALIAKMLRDARAIPPQARDDAPRANDAWWALLGVASALGWIVGLAAWGVWG